MSERLPDELRSDLARAVRLEWWTLGWMASVIALMAVVMGSSQAMRTAWIEDVLSLVPAIVLLVSVHFERKPADRHFPYGYDRVNSLAFVIAATALTLVGGLLLVESAVTLIKQEHVTIAPVTLFGHTFWQGWLMVAALAYSIVPPVILGHLKLPLAKRLQDKVLHTDALMQKADWMTGLAGIGGIVGLGLGWWWADAGAALIISFSILHDGLKALRTATAELVDGTPRALDSAKLAEDAVRLEQALQRAYPSAEVRLRETGRFVHAQLLGVEPDAGADRASLWPGPPERAWRFAQLSFAPPGDEPAYVGRLRSA
jgi:cation diffusion facilitator family transporter